MAPLHEYNSEPKFLMLFHVKHDHYQKLSASCEAVEPYFG